MDEKRDQEQCAMLYVKRFITRPRDLSKLITDPVIRSEQGLDAIVKAAYKRDPLAVVSIFHQNFIDLLSTRRG